MSNKGRLQDLQNKYSLSENKTKTFQGKELRVLLDDLVTYNELCVGSTLEKYQMLCAFDMAGRMIRGIEEFINLFLENIKTDCEKILSFPIGNNIDDLPELIKKFNHVLFEKDYSEKLVARLTGIYLQLNVLIPVFRAVNIDVDIKNVSEGISYLQSRRAYLPTIQPLILKYCKGTEEFKPTEVMAVFFPLAYLPKKCTTRKKRIGVLKRTKKGVRNGTKKTKRRRNY